MKLNMKTYTEDGKLITFCGLDGCGKTTLINMLSKYFIDKNKKVFITKQPTPEFRKNHIFRNFMDKEDNSAYDYRALSLMAAADRIQHSNKVIVPKLKEGYIVISDRYFYSCLANLQARGFNEDKWIYEIAKNIPNPDYAFFLDVNVELAIKRIRNRPSEKDRFIDIDLQHKLKNNYLKIANENDGYILKTSEQPEDAFKKILDIIE